VSGAVAARMLGPANRGFLALLVAVPSIVAQLGGLGVNLGIVHFAAQNPGSSVRLFATVQRLAARQIPLLMVVHCGIVFGLLHAFRGGGVRAAAAISLISVPGALALSYSLALLQGLHHFRSFNCLRLLPTFLYSALLCAAFSLGSHSLVVASLLLACATVCAAGVAVGLALRAAKQHAAPNAPAPNPRALVTFGLRGVFGSISPLETFRLDQLLVGTLLSPAALGIYAVGVAFTNLPRFVAQSVGMIAYPAVAARRARMSTLRRVVGFMPATAAVTAVLVMVLELTLGVLIPTIFGSRFASAVPVGRVLLIGAFFLSLRVVLADSVRGAGAPGLGALAELAGILFLLGALPFAVPRGLVAVAAAFSGAAFLSLLTLVCLCVFASGRARGHAGARLLIAHSSAQGE
jgi:O-antigen/teichoic acid export membrane protein